MCAFSVLLDLYDNILLSLPALYLISHLLINLYCRSRKARSSDMQKHRLQDRSSEDSKRRTAIRQFC